MAEGIFPRRVLLRQAQLSRRDHDELRDLRVDHTRLGFACQLAFIRLTGRLPGQKPIEVAEDLLLYVAQQLGFEDRARLRDFVRKQAEHLEPTAGLVAAPEEFLRRTRVLLPALSTIRRVVVEERAGGLIPAAPLFPLPIPGLQTPHVGQGGHLSVQRQDFQAGTGVLVGNEAVKKTGALGSLQG